MGVMVNRTGSPLSGNKVGLVLPQSYKMQLSSEKWIPSGESKLECRLKGTKEGSFCQERRGAGEERKREGSGGDGVMEYVWPSRESTVSP